MQEMVCRSQCPGQGGSIQQMTEESCASYAGDAKERAGKGA
jgi:hypothetical protein